MAAAHEPPERLLALFLDTASYPGFLEQDMAGLVVGSANSYRIYMDVAKSARFP